MAVVTILIKFLLVTNQTLGKGSIVECANHPRFFHFNPTRSPANKLFGWLVLSATADEGDWMALWRNNVAIEAGRCAERYAGRFPRFSSPA